MLKQPGTMVLPKTYIPYAVAKFKGSPKKTHLALTQREYEYIYNVANLCVVILRYNMRKTSAGIIMFGESDGDLQMGGAPGLVLKFFRCFQNQVQPSPGVTPNEPLINNYVGDGEELPREACEVQAALRMDLIPPKTATLEYPPFEPRTEPAKFSDLNLELLRKILSYNNIELQIDNNVVHFTYQAERPGAQFDAKYIVHACKEAVNSVASIRLMTRALDYRFKFDFELIKVQPIDKKFIDDYKGLLATTKEKVDDHTKILQLFSESLPHLRYESLFMTTISSRREDNYLFSVLDLELAHKLNETSYRKNFITCIQYFITHFDEATKFIQNLEIIGEHNVYFPQQSQAMLAVNKWIEIYECCGMPNNILHNSRSYIFLMTIKEIWSICISNLIVEFEYMNCNEIFSFNCLKVYRKLQPATGALPVHLKKLIDELFASHYNLTTYRKNNKLMISVEWIMIYALKHIFLPIVYPMKHNWTLFKYFIGYGTYSRVMELQNNIRKLLKISYSEHMVPTFELIPFRNILTDNLYDDNSLSDPYLDYVNKYISNLITWKNIVLEKYGEFLRKIPPLKVKPDSIIIATKVDFINRLYDFIVASYKMMYDVSNETRSSVKDALAKYIKGFNMHLQMKHLDLLFTDKGMIRPNKPSEVIITLEGFIGRDHPLVKKSILSCVTNLLILTEEEVKIVLTDIIFRQDVEIDTGDVSWTYYYDKKVHLRNNDLVQTILERKIRRLDSTFERERELYDYNQQFYDYFVNDGTPSSAPRGGCPSKYKKLETRHVPGVGIRIIYEYRRKKYYKTKGQYVRL
jgi:hypothetical protein